MAPLTRNQQAALQANPGLSRQQPAQHSASSLANNSHQPGAATPSSSIARLRSGDPHQQQAGLSADANVALGQYGTQDKAPLGALRVKQTAQHDTPPDLDQYSHLDSLSFDPETSDAVAAAATDAHRLADWGNFGHGSALMTDMYTDGPEDPSHQSSPYYGLSSQPQQRNHSSHHQAASHFMPSFSDMSQRDQHMFEQSWRQDETGHAEGGHQNVPLGSPFAPAGNSTAIKTGGMAGAGFSSDTLDGPTRRLSLAQMPQHHMSMGMHPLQGHPMGMQLSTPPVGARRSLGRQDEDFQEFHTTPHSMGQMGMQINASHDGMLHLSAQGGTPNDRFESNRSRLVSQSSSLHSPSPSNVSSTSTAYLMSPHTSISTRRHGGDSSVDTSIDSISNSAASMSADLSRSSSTSDDLMSIGGTSASSKKSIKGKTRLRNIDRKLICEAARDDPTRRQEDLAAQFGIERSTVSKTLKNKDKWLAIKESSDGAMIIKHRNGKFPQLEEALVGWAREEAQKGIYVLDVSIKQRALELAKQCGLGVDSFKASVGWIEKFRERHDLPKQGPLCVSMATPSLPIGSSDSPQLGLSSGADKSGGPQVVQQHQQQRKSLRRASTRMRDSRMSSMSGLSESAGSERLLEQVDEEEVDMDAPHSPIVTGRSLRNQLSSSSISTEESMQPVTTSHETPKASKRHYDDMNQKPNSSIDSGMAKMHFVASKAEAMSETREGESDEAEMSPLMEKSDSLHNVTKRRRGDEGNLQLQQQQQHAASGQRQPAHGGRQRSETVHGEMTVAEYQQKRPQHTHQRQYSHGGPISAPPFQTHMPLSPLENMHQAVHTHAMQEDAAGKGGAPAGAASASSPASRLARSSYRHYSQAATSTAAGIPSPIDEQPTEDEEDDEETEAAMNTSTEFPLTHVGIAEDRQVSLDEARGALDLVLAFIARQPANLSPSDYFVLGNLQGTLSALAGQNSSPQ